MSTIWKSLMGAGVALALMSPAHAQGPVMQKNVSLDMAKKIAEATLAECKKRGFNTAVAVVDRSGQMILGMRTDEAAPQTLEMARRKAYTARMFRRTSLDWAKRTLEDPTLMPQRDLADVIALGGGVPLMIGSDAIGAVGSAGAGGQPEDDACAQAGVAAVAAALK